jgi:hypothetical protein
MEVQPAEIAASNGVQSLDLEGLILDSLVAARLDHGQACACMADEDGKPLDQSQWKRMRASGNLPLGRMRQLPLAFWQCFIPVLARAAGLCVVRAEDVAQFVIRVNVERRVG